MQFTILSCSETSGFLCEQLTSYVKCSIIRCLIISLISGQREMALVGIATLFLMQICQVVADIDQLGNEVNLLHVADFKT